MSEANNQTQAQNKKEIATAYIIKKGKSFIVPLFDYSELKIVDEVLSQNQSKKKDGQNLYKFL